MGGPGIVYVKVLAPPTCQVLPTSIIKAKISTMAKRLFDSPVFRARPLFSLPQVIFFLVIVVAIIIAVDLNNRAQAGPCLLYTSRCV